MSLAAPRFAPYVCLYMRQTFGLSDSDTFSFLALRSRFKSGSNHLAASSATKSAKEFAKPILFCVMTDRPTSSKCDLTLRTSVTPLRSSISWNKIDHKSPLGPCSRSHLCAMPLVTYFASIGIGMFDFSSTRLRIWMAPRHSALGTVRLLGTWLPQKPVRSNFKDV